MKTPEKAAQRAVRPVHLPVADGELIGKAVARLGTTFSAFLRETAVERARAVLEAPESPAEMAPAA